MDSEFRSGNLVQTQDANSPFRVRISLIEEVELLSSPLTRNFYKFKFSDGLGFSYWFSFEVKLISKSLEEVPIEDWAWIFPQLSQRLQSQVKELFGFPFQPFDGEIL